MRPGVRPFAHRGLHPTCSPPCAACSLQPAACSPRVSQAVRGAYVVDAKIMTRAKRCVVSKY